MFGDGPPPYRAEIGPLLREGENTVTLQIFKAGSLYERPACCAMIEIATPEGTERIPSDATWQVALEPHGTAARTAVALATYGDQPWGTQGAGDGGQAIGKAREVLAANPEAFLDEYFQVVPNERSHGLFSVTSC